MNCHSVASRLSLAALLLYLMLFVDKPLLPEALRDPAMQVISGVKSKVAMLSSNVRNMLMSLMGKADEVISSVGSTSTGFESIPKLENDADLEAALSKSSRLLVMACKLL
ncbi:MAG: hypothetical protein MHPSP_003579 [Paramarteilia canceri]